MLGALLSARILCLAVVPCLAQDPAVGDAKHDQVAFQDYQVMVLRITYGPNENLVMHEHVGAVAVFLTDQHVRFTCPAGESEER